MDVKESLVEDQQMQSCVQSSTWIMIVQHLSTWLALCNSFLDLSCSFHLAFMSCHFPSLCIKHRPSKGDMFKPVRWISRKGSRFLYILLSFSLSFSLCCRYRFGGLCRLPSSGFMKMYMYKLFIVWFYSYRFLGRRCIGSVEVQAKLKLNARGYEIPSHMGLSENSGPLNPMALSYFSLLKLQHLFRLQTHLFLL